MSSMVIEYQILSFQLKVTPSTTVCNLLTHIGLPQITIFLYRDVHIAGYVSRYADIFVQPSYTIT